MTEDKVKNLSKSYRYYKDLFESIFENLRNGLVLLNKDSLIIKVNPAFERYLGYTADELEGKNFLDLVPEEECSRLIEYRNARTSGKEAPGEYETILSTKDGEIRNFLFSVSSEPGNGNIIVDLRDITDKKRLENEKEKLMSIMRHDMGNIIQVLKFSSKNFHRLYPMLMNLLSEMDEETYKKLISSKIGSSDHVYHEIIMDSSVTVISNVDALHTLLDEIRDYNKLQKEVYKLSQENVYQSVELVIKDHSKQLEEANIKVTNSIPSPMELNIWIMRNRNITLR
jgi:PAS domain S-box-containing protein